MRLVVVLSGVVLLLALELVLMLEVSWDGRFSWTVKCSKGYISARARAVLGESTPTCVFVSSRIWTSGDSMLSQRTWTTYVDYASVTQTAPVQSPEQLNHRIARVPSQPPERIPRSLQSWLLDTSRLELRCLLEYTTVALGVRAATTLLRSMSHLQCRWRYSSREEQRGVQVRKVGDEGC